MTPIFRNSQVAVFDGVLPEQEFADLGRHLQKLDYRHVHRDKLHGVWRPQDGDPFEGDRVLCLGREPEAFGGLAALAAAGHVVYPTGTQLDAPLERILTLAAEVEALVGRRGHDWYALQSRPWLYPAGTRLSWHHDTDEYCGSFVFYTHPHWNAFWGGELLVASEGPEGSVTYGEEANGGALNLDSEPESRALLREGHGQFFAPKPNRLIFIAGGAPHMIAHVSPAAGENVRTSLGGFFLRAPAGAENMLQMLFGRAC
jgi:hypothetical protein